MSGEMSQNYASGRKGRLDFLGLGLAVFALEGNLVDFTFESAFPLDGDEAGFGPGSTSASGATTLTQPWLLFPVGSVVDQT